MIVSAKKIDPPQNLHSNKIKDIIRALLKCLVNGLCLGFVIWQIIKCSTKYIEKPQGTDVRQKKISDLPSPAITVCGDFGEDGYYTLFLYFILTISHRNSKIHSKNFSSALRPHEH